MKGNKYGSQKIEFFPQKVLKWFKKEKIEKYDKTKQPRGATEGWAPENFRVRGFSRSTKSTIVDEVSRLY